MKTTICNRSSVIVEIALAIIFLIVMWQLKNFQLLYLIVIIPAYISLTFLRHYLIEKSIGMMVITHNEVKTQEAFTMKLLGYFVIIFIALVALISALQHEYIMELLPGNFLVALIITDLFRSIYSEREAKDNLSKKEKKIKTSKIAIQKLEEKNKKLENNVRILKDENRKLKINHKKRSKYGIV